MIISQEQMFGLDDSHLVTLNDGHRLVEEVANKFSEMQRAAKSAGHDLQICSSYRSFDRQLQIWNKKWLGKLPLLNLQNETLNATALNEDQKIHAIMLWSALPGASRHHWGTDIDVFDKSKVESWDGTFSLVPQEYENNGPCAELSDWLTEHAREFDFHLPYSKYVGGVAREPWHLSYIPIAESIIKGLSINKLVKLLENSDVEGKTHIIPQIDYLFSRYTLNKGA